MTIPFACLFIMAIVTIFSKTPVAIAQARKPGGYDNSDPREQQKLLEGQDRRALAGHQNGFEAFMFFVAGVLVAHVGVSEPGAGSWLAAVFSLLFVITRLTYHWAYLVDRSTLRSITWGVAYACCLGLMAMPLIF